MSDLSMNTAAPARALASDAGVGDFVALLKPRVMSLVVFTGFAGLYLAPGKMHPFLAAVAVLAIAVGAGAAGAINMWYDRDIDAIMTRTRERPLPAGRIEPGDALGFGVALALLSVMVMGLAVNYAAAALLALTIGFYVFVYTAWLKRRTPQNIVIGGASGAFPPVIGWAAATGEVSLGSLALFALIFMWTPPLSLGPYALGVAGAAYAAIAAAMSLCFVGLTLRLMRDAENKTAMRVFGFSILYLFVLFAAMIADRAVTG